MQGEPGGDVYAKVKIIESTDIEKAFKICRDVTDVVPLSIVETTCSSNTHTRTINLLM